MSTLIRLPEGSVCWPAASLSSASLDVKHVSTRVDRPQARQEIVTGLTRWEKTYADVIAWIEWDWAAAVDGFVAQQDPLNIRSNVLLLDDRNKPLLSSRRRATLATLVYQLPWQGPVLDEIRRTTSIRRIEEELWHAAA